MTPARQIDEEEKTAACTAVNLKRMLIEILLLKTAACTAVNFKSKDDDASTPKTAACTAVNWNNSRLSD
ncbi:TPA: hypothetical protein J1246_002028 [Escherichia coli]|nr:hypothetical protein [Escherichia coli]